MHCELGRGPLVLPVRMVRDIIAAQNGHVVPVPLLLRAGKFAPEFLLPDVIGLWTGDTASSLVEQVSSGAKEGLGPRNVIEITVSRERGD